VQHPNKKQSTLASTPLTYCLIIRRTGKAEKSLNADQ
jgi:hypothetical protein